MKRLIIVALALSSAAIAQQNRGSRTGSMQPRSTSQTDTHRTSRSAKPNKAAQPVTGVVLTPELVARLQPLLPESMTVEAAAQGFKSTRQFVSAVHLSKNVEIPFAGLKAQMTGSETKSLNDAVEALKPDLPAAKRTEAVREATRQARQDESDARAQ
jgi:hypothetical protein